MEETVWPLYFGHSWAELSISFSLDFETGRNVKSAVVPALEFDRLAMDRYLDSAFLYTDGACDDVSKEMGVGFYVPSVNYRFGIVSQVSPVSSRLNSIFCTLEYVYQMSFPSTVVFTDSIYAMYHLRDKLFSLLTSPYVYKIMHVVSHIQEHDCSVGFVWIPSRFYLRADQGSSAC